EFFRRPSFHSPHPSEGTSAGAQFLWHVALSTKAQETSSPIRCDGASALATNVATYIPMREIARHITVKRRASMVSPYPSRGFCQEPGEPVLRTSFICHSPGTWLNTNKRPA